MKWGAHILNGGPGTTRGVRTQVFSSPTPVLIQEVGILILIQILFATQL